MPNILELEGELENGFHDAFIERVQWIESAREFVLDLDVWIGRFDPKDIAARELHRPARLTFHGVVISPGSVTVLDAFIPQCCDLDSTASTPNFARFFLYEQNAFLEIRHETAEFAWLG